VPQRDAARCIPDDQGRFQAVAVGLGEDVGGSGEVVCDETESGHVRRLSRRSGQRAGVHRPPFVPACPLLSEGVLRSLTSNSNQNWPILNEAHANRTTQPVQMTSEIG